MLKFLKLGLMKKGVLTKEYPYEECVLHSAFMGLPVVDLASCDRCDRCTAVCPTGAMTLVPSGVAVDAGRCLFCGACADACPKCVHMGHAFELAVKDKGALQVVYGHG